MTQVLELDKKYKITVLNMIRAPVKKVDNIQKQIHNKRYGNPKNQKKMLEIVNNVELLLSMCYQLYIPLILSSSTK